MRKKQIILAILSLLCGGIIYLSFRSSNLLIFKWVSFFHLDVLVTYLRMISCWKKMIPRWVIYSLPDGLWMFSGTTLILNVWNNIISKQSIFWIILMPLGAFFFEYLQKLKYIRGTFDFLDIANYLIGFTASILIYTNITKQKRI